MRDSIAGFMVFNVRVNVSVLTFRLSRSLPQPSGEP